jgi:UDP-N-acetylglucosamine--N-acetylmuramyl-(pentapeptide) pyrophosphoryl-undecaprenol N-acetylglucosamine transferase
MESTLVPKEGFPIYYINIRGFKRRFSFYNIGTAVRSLTSQLEAGRILREFDPDVVVGTGGYVSGPVLLCAARRGYPTAIHEQNAYPALQAACFPGRWTGS